MHAASAVNAAVWPDGKLSVPWVLRPKSGLHTNSVNITVEAGPITVTSADNQSLSHAAATANAAVISANGM